MASLPQLLLERGLVSRERLEVALAEVARDPRGDSRGALALVLLRARWVDPLALRALIAAADPESVALGRVAAPEPKPGALLGPYQLLGELARGGMGVVYEARHRETGARYALKTLQRIEAGEELERFRREARLAAALDHPHVARVHAAELERAPAFLVQDLLPGGDLEQRVARGGPLSLEEGCAVVAKLAAAVAYAHERGVLHRDLKPANVLFDERGEPALTDFGLARSLSGASLELTQTGELLGTPAYMAPEQIEDARSAGPACDVYALGGVLSFALTGRAPFTGPSLWNVLDQVLHEPPPELSAGCPGASPELSALVTRALAKDPAERPSARELADALAEGGRLGARERRGARASGRVAGLLVVGLALLSGAALSTRSPGAQPAPGASVAGSAATRAPRSEGPELAELRRQLESPDALAAGVAAAALHEEGQVLPGVGRALRVLAGGIQLTDAYPGDIPEIAFDARPDRAWLFLHHDGTLVAWDLAAGSAPRWTLKSGEALQPPRHLANRLSAGRGRLLFQCRESSESGVGHETVLVELGEALVEPEFLPPRANGFAGHKKGMYSALSPDGQRVALISRNDGKLLVYDAAGRQLAAGEALTGTIRSFEFGPEGLDLYAHYHRVVEEERRRGHLLRFDLRRGAARAELITSSTSPSLAVGGGRVALSHGNLVTLCRFDLSEPRHFLFPSELAEGAGLSQWLSARVCLDPRRPRLYGMCSRTRMEGKEGVFECWDLEQRVALWTRRIPAGARNPTLSPDGRWLVWLREHDLAGREAHDLRLFYVGPLPGSGHSLSSRPLKELAKDALPLDSNEKR